MKLPGFPLDRVLQRQENNLDLIRLFAAACVLYSHAFTVTYTSITRQVQWDPALRLFGYDGVYVGSIGVKIFFFISGLLVTDSLMRKEDPIGFIVARIARIWPALLALLLVTTCVIGPLCSDLPAGEYFRHPATWLYFVQNLFLQNNNFLPGVFANNASAHNVNLSLWSLAYEVAAYAITLALFAFSLLQRRWLGMVFLAVLFLEPLLPRPILFPWWQGNPHYTYLPICFAWGAVFAVNKDKITLGPRLLLGLFVALLVLKKTFLGTHALFLALFVTLLYLSALPAVRKLRLGFDPSYGMYLWGFVIQQIVALHFSGLGWKYNLLVSIPLTFLAGLVSWHFVERPALTFARRFAARRETLVLPA